MTDITNQLEEKLDLFATRLAELMLSQLGYRFIPNVFIYPYRLFRVIVGFEIESINYSPFYKFESLNLEISDEYYQYEQFSINIY